MDNFRGSVLMVLAMLAFAIVDAIIKATSDILPVGQIVLILGTGGAVVLSAVALRQNPRAFLPYAWHPLIILRNLSEALGSLCFVTALSLIPLSTASAVLQATPLIVTIGAGLFLGEAIGWRRWTAIAVGLAGVLMILRPGLEGFDANVLFAIGGVVGLGARDLITRMVPKSIPSSNLAAYAFLFLIPTGWAMMLMAGQDWVTPPPALTGQLALAIAIVIGAYFAIIGATRIGDLSAIAPFRYTRIVFALIIGAIFFAERPDALTLLGAAIIVGSGLYTLWRESRLNRHKPAL